MLITNNPYFLKPHKLGMECFVLDAEVYVQDLVRMKGLIENQDGLVRFHLSFRKDDSNRTVIQGNITMCCQMQCKRCLNLVDISVVSTPNLVAVETENQAKLLPSHYDSLFIKNDGTVDLFYVLEEELLLAMPIIPFHENLDCAINLHHQKSFDAQNIEDKTIHRKAHNPFDVLVNFKKSKY